jgi:MFS family permease
MTESVKTVDPKWRVLIGGFFGYVFDALDLTLLGFALPAIIKDLGISMVEAGLLGTATFIGIGLSGFIMGWYADNYGRKKAMLWSLISFGILTAGVAFAPGFMAIMVLRFFAGVGLGGLWGIAATYIAETWPATQRARATAVVLGSFPVGAGLAAFLASIILPRYGWRALFLFGAISLLAAVYVYFFVPESMAWKEQKENRLKEVAATQKIRIREIFSRDLIMKTVIGTIAASLALLATWGTGTWLPTFLVNERSVPFATMSKWMMLYALSMLIGYLFFGYFGDKIGRKKAVVFLFLGATITLPIAVYAPNLNILFWMVVVYGFFGSFAGLFGTMFAEMYPTRVRALGTGFCFNIGRGVSAFGPLLLGYIATSHGLSTGLLICAGFWFLAAVTIVFLPQTQQVVNSQGVEQT